MRVVGRTALTGVLAVFLTYWAITERDSILALLGAWNTWIFVAELRVMRLQERANGRR